jgi:dipeptidase E
MAPYQSIKISQQIYGEDFDQAEDGKSLGYVDFHIVPHLNGTGFPGINEQSLREVLKDFKEKIYCIDDNTAIAVVDGRVEVASEGEYFVVN